MATPASPQRPARSQNINVPTIPPRPMRCSDRSVSPGHSRFAPSPLNQPGFFPPTARLASAASKSGGADDWPASLTSPTGQQVPSRPPSVSLPTIGQEGQEYEGTYEPEAGATHVTSTISGQLPLHAPTASVPAATAKFRIQAVTRTNSDLAAAAGIGKLNKSQESIDKLNGQPRLASEAARSDTASSPSQSAALLKSEDDGEHGIPRIGQQIPLIPKAGDVQAPTPVSHNRCVNGATPHHFRTKSGREFFRGPPGSYGLHGHGIKAADPLTRQWYDRHPEERAREVEGEYGPKIPGERKQYTLTSAELNNLVHSPQNHEEVGTPDMHIGYLASEEYAQRMATNALGSSSASNRLAQTYLDPAPKTTGAAQDETADGGDALGDSDYHQVIHVDPSAPQITEPAASSYDSQTGQHQHYNFDQPILAADEVAKRPEGRRYMAPAVELDERHVYDVPALHSRSTSRNRQGPSQNSPAFSPVAMQYTTTGVGAEAVALENVREYEPLFPDSNNEILPVDKTGSEIADSLPRHYFPSNDVWEDVPESMEYVTTVATPQIPEFAHRYAEHEDQEYFALDDQNKIVTSQDKTKVQSPAKLNFNQSLRAEMGRSGMQHRFPSQDVWEDAPDSSIVTTTLEPKPEPVASTVEADDGLAPPRPKPQVPARPGRFPDQSARDDARDDVQAMNKSLSEEEKHPQITTPKTKPPVPARPGTKKLPAAYEAFMHDLSTRIGAGPPPPKSYSNDPAKERQQEEDASQPQQQLTDIRKGRARGPARRTPGLAAGSASDSSKTAGKSPGNSGDVATPKPAANLSLVGAVTVWEINQQGSVALPRASKHDEADEIDAEPEDKTEPKAENKVANPVEDTDAVEVENKNKISSAQALTSTPAEGVIL